MNKTRIICTILSAAICPIAFWLGGYNFDERGMLAVLLFLYTIGVTALVAFAPWWNEK